MVERVDGAIAKQPSEQEMHERRVFVRSLHSLGMRGQEIVERAILPTTNADGSVTPPRFTCKEEAIRRLINEIRSELARELEVFLPTARAAGLERLYQHLLRANSDLQQLRSAAKKDWSAIRGHMTEIRGLENQIAKMEGTLDPVKVDVRHSGELSVNLTRAIASMTPDQHEQAIREEQARLLLEQGSITTSGEDASQTPPTVRGRQRQALPAPSPSGMLAGTGQAPVADPSRHGTTPQRGSASRERSSDITARREVRSPMDADVEARAGQRSSGPRVIG